MTYTPVRKNITKFILKTSRFPQVSLNRCFAGAVRRILIASLVTCKPDVQQPSLHITNEPSDLKTTEKPIKAVSQRLVDPPQWTQLFSV